LFGGLSGTYANSNDIEGTLINGLSTIPNTLISKESVNRAKTSYERYLDVSRQLDNYEQMYSEAGTELVGSKAEAMNAAYRGILMSLKELENLGVLNGQDLLIMQDMVPAISGVKATARGILNSVLGDKVKGSLSQLKNRIATKVDANLQTNGFIRNDKPIEDKKESAGTTETSANKYLEEIRARRAALQNGR
jgi:predicted TIM-barrel enzyme